MVVYSRLGDNDRVCVRKELFVRHGCGGHQADRVILVLRFREKVPPTLRLPVFPVRCAVCVRQILRHLGCKVLQLLRGKRGGGSKRGRGVQIHEWFLVL